MFFRNSFVFKRKNCVVQLMFKEFAESMKNNDVGTEFANEK